MGFIYIDDTDITEIKESVPADNSIPPIQVYTCDKGPENIIFCKNTKELFDIMGFPVTMMNMQKKEEND